MNSSLITRILTCTQLERASGLQDIQFNNGQHCLSDDPSHHLSNTNRTHTWTFIKCNQMASSKSLKTRWINTRSTQPTSNQSQGLAKIIRSPLKRSTKASPTKSIKPRWTGSTPSTKSKQHHESKPHQEHQISQDETYLYSPPKF